MGYIHIWTCPELLKWLLSVLKHCINSHRNTYSEICLYLSYATSFFKHTHIIIVRLSLLTMSNPNQIREVLLFVCSKMADETDLGSKLPVADRTREVWERKLCCWCLSSGFPLARLRWFFLLRTHQHPFLGCPPLCLILCNLFPRLCLYVEVFKGDFEGILGS